MIFFWGLFLQFSSYISGDIVILSTLTVWECCFLINSFNDLILSVTETKFQDR